MEPLAEPLRGGVGGEGDHVDACCVQHELDRHQDQHGVAPRQHAVDADGEEERAEDEEVLERDLLGDGLHPTLPLPVARG